MNKKTTVCVIIYNRFFNLVHWLDCWKKCDKQNAEVVIIHNTDQPAPEYRELCEKHAVGYIPRRNVGFDIGAFQDVCKGRLKGFPQWERLLWMTDDTFPMTFDFVEQFNKGMRPGVGVVAMEISPYVVKHIRTTGFMIDRDTAEKLIFPADPIVTKQHCYLFEHRWGKKVFYSQIVEMGLKVVWAAGREHSPLWDTGYHRRVDRKAEHEAKFGKYQTADKVLFICPIYQSYPQIISSLLLQTHKNWELYLVHDGPDTTGVKNLIPDDKRIHFRETRKRGGCWGHYIRSIFIQESKNISDFVVVTNADNYHTPVFCEYMLKAFERRPASVAVYCSHMVHSYKAWQVLPCSLNVGFLDSAGVMVRSENAAAVGWNDITTHSADWQYFADLIATYGADKFYRVEGCLLVHN